MDKMTKAVIKYIANHPIDGLPYPIIGPNELNFEMSAKWIHAAYLSMFNKNRDDDRYKEFPIFVCCYTPNELTMFLVDDENNLYYFEWGEREAVFVRKERLYL